MSKAKYIADTIRAVRKYNQLANSANNRGLEFNLTFTEVKKLSNSKVCYYTGVRFDPSSEDTKFSVDRIDCTKGYVKGNVVACTIRINKIKARLLEDRSNPHAVALSDIKALASKL
jgi:hypothetical protein